MVHAETAQSQRNRDRVNEVQCTEVHFHDVLALNDGGVLGEVELNGRSDDILKGQHRRFGAHSDAPFGFQNKLPPPGENRQVVAESLAHMEQNRIVLNVGELCPAGVEVVVRDLRRFQNKLGVTVHKHAILSPQRGEIEAAGDPAGQSLNLDRRAAQTVVPSLFQNALLLALKEGLCAALLCQWQLVLGAGEVGDQLLAGFDGVTDARGSEALVACEKLVMWQPTGQAGLLDFYHLEHTTVQQLFVHEFRVKHTRQTLFVAFYAPDEV
mmetsp:Transcript_56063/g.98322  ORF Transcript_56063/g.98322 Transcript_56063/m.98322 type:complete len:268 (+) Transcript_56063:779-1582(+)